MKHKNEGFTLIELLIVVAIIAILAAIAVPNFLEAQVRAKVIRTISDMRTVNNGLHAYVVDHNQIPTNQSFTFGLGSRSTVKIPHWVVDIMLLEGDSQKHMGTNLTTPIPYLSDFPYDYFNTRQFKGSGFFRSEPRMSFVFSGIPLGGDKAMYDSWRPNFNLITFSFRWLMESCGPDLIWWAGGVAGGSGSGTGGSWNKFFYDPTNGTISDGQLLFFDNAHSFPRL